MDHGYHLETLYLDEPKNETTQPQDLRKTGENIAAKMKGALEIAQAELAAAQERQEKYANRHRSAAPNYRIGQKVWLDLHDISTDRPSKKLDARHAKYTITKCISPHAYQLDTPDGIHNVFHVDKLRPAADDPFPNQCTDDYQPPAVLNEGNEEWHIDKIEEYKEIRRGRGVQ